MAKITDALAATGKVLLSLEFTPPDRGGTIDEIYRSVEQLLPFNPQFINVTYHQPHLVTETRNGAAVRRPKRKKPGTVGICAAIHNKFGIETVPHILCGGFNRYETEDALIDLHYLGFRNLFVIRGDPPQGVPSFAAEPDGHRYAAELIAQIAAMNRGAYLEPLDDPEPTDFCIGAAGYPENHYESPSFDAELA
ncbi:MAG TPA: methylenetetrahydrofolate reductase, partial [bacterium]|nr:methylenetetrahydrofolate reductase [bacterium]